MKQENLDKVKEAIKAEFGVNDSVAEFTAKAAMEGIQKALLELANKVLSGVEENKT